MKPTTREQFKNYCLRKLGSPVIRINVSPDQVDDRIDEAIEMYRQWHFDANERILYSYKLTAQDVANKYITLPEAIYGVTRILPLSAHDWGSFFSFRYQFMLNEVAFAPNFDLVPYYNAMSYINTLEDFFESKAFVRFNRHTNILHIDTNWSILAPNSYLVIDAAQYIDPDVMTDMWNDLWLQRYATALIKRQWGENMSKYTGTVLIGGNTFSGEQIIVRATEEIEKLELELKTNYTMPPIDFMAS